MPLCRESEEPVSLCHYVENKKSLSLYAIMLRIWRACLFLESRIVYIYLSQSTWMMNERIVKPFIPPPSLFFRTAQLDPHNLGEGIGGYRITKLLKVGIASQNCWKIASQGCWVAHLIIAKGGHCISELLKMGISSQNCLKWASYLRTAADGHHI